MKWVRSHIRHGARLALFALAVQFVLSFGHFHGIAAQAAPVIQSAKLSNSARLSAAYGTAETQQPTSDRDTDPQGNDVCAICAVVALAGTALFASPPLLLLPQGIELLYRITDAEFVHLNSPRLAFQPRAPPVS